MSAQPSPSPAPPSPTAPPSLPAGLEEWASILRSQSAPDVFETYGDEDELAEAQGHVQEAIAAAAALYHARHKLMQAIIDGTTLGQDKARRNALLRACEEALFEVFWRALRGIAVHAPWIDSSLPRPSRRSGREMLCHTPTSLATFSTNAGGCTYEIAHMASTINSLWESMQDRFLRLYRDSYRRSDGELDAFRDMCDPFSLDMQEEGNKAHEQFMATIPPALRC